ncbi:U3 snoRNP protein [Stygiomarasmius scandens]|uniref:U3 snoRNP protein n=1 Tax=Marasmiellus scandens TaxID=2682957 RepID=A0ABR1ITP8_9AGAR
MTHGRFLRDRSGEYASVFRSLQKALGEYLKVYLTISSRCKENIPTLSYIKDQAKIQQADVEMSDV